MMAVFPEFQKPYNIHIIGLVNDVKFHMARTCAEDLHGTFSDRFLAPVVDGMLEFQWLELINAKRKEIGEEMWSFDDNSLVYINKVLIGGPSRLIEWASFEHGFRNFRPFALYETIAEEAYKSYLTNKPRDFVFMDFTIGGEPAGRLVIELFRDIVPRTSENFRALCTGEMGESAHTEFTLHYKNSIMHRIVKNGWIQGGDIFMRRGDGGESIYGPMFDDENYGMMHTGRGIVGMANKGRHTNSSQFYICLQPCPWMDRRYVAFGQVVEGTDTLAKLEAENTMNQRPLREVLIADCGSVDVENLSVAKLNQDVSINLPTDLRA